MARVNNFLENKGFLGTDMTHQRNWEKGGFVSNLISGGQNGYGFKAGSFDAATPLALPPAVIVVLQTPTMWDKITQDTEHVLPQTVKSMFECHAKSVSGIELSYTLETQDQPIGHDGQTFKVPTQSKRADARSASACRRSFMKSDFPRNTEVFRASCQEERSSGLRSQERS